ncbi:MAG: carboxy terminal-processing peptidase [Pseudomonadota bacterium]|nr:carboxy terminal-processing peptidase [Pseudomonadota bacterium]
MNTRLSLMIALLLGSFGATLSHAQAPLPRPSAGLTPTEDLSNAALWATRFLTRFHYKRVPLDDAMSGRMLDRFIESLDADKMMFLATDIDEFNVYRKSLDDAIFDQQLDPPFVIYARYRTRMEERTRHARELIKQGFDFTVDERYEFDREEAPWAKTNAELDDLWRKRIKNDWLRLKLAGKNDKGIAETLDKRYRGYTDRLGDLDKEDIFQNFMNAYTQEIEPHTNYLGPRTSENFNIQMRLSLEGIGAVLQREDEYTVIRQIVKGGPAAKSGKLKAGDRIVGVGQGTESAMTDVVGWKVDDVVEQIRGKKGTTLRIDVLPADAGADGKIERIVMVREKVKLEDQAAKSSLIEIGDPRPRSAVKAPAADSKATQPRAVSEGPPRHRIGVIALPTFYHDFEGARRGDADYRSSTRDVVKLINKLKTQHIDGLVVDLRGNGGGSLTEATDLTGLFIKEGPVVQVRDAQGRVSLEQDRDPTVTWDGPLVVVIDRESASASEIFAAAMQDYGRALIVGETSYGKGTVQNLVDLDNIAQNEVPKYGQLKMTVAQFFRVDGGSTQHKGVVPDVMYPQTWDPKDFGESALDNSLPWTSIKPADYSISGDLHPLVPLLTAKHEARSAKDKEFIWWADDLAHYRKQREEKELSLLESVRRTERDQQDKKRELRKQERIAAGLADNKAEATTDDGLQANERRVVDDAAETDEADLPNFLVKEAAHVLADAIDLLASDRRLAERVKSFNARDSSLID